MDDLLILSSTKTFEGVSVKLKVNQNIHRGMHIYIYIYRHSANSSYETSIPRGSVVHKVHNTLLHGFVLNFDVGKCLDILPACTSILNDLRDR